MDLRETLIACRKRKGLSQLELAEALDVSRQTVSKWETGAALPAAEHLLALSRLYGVSVDALLKGAESDRIPPEPAPAVVEERPAPPPALEPAVPLRRRWPRMLAAVLLFDLVMFLLYFYLSILPVRDIWYGLFDPLLRVLGCFVMGLVFARQYRDRPTNRAHLRCLGLAALALGVYVFLMPVPLLWRLYDHVTWIGTYGDALIPANPLFFFLGWTLFEEYAFASHMLLIAVFCLGRLWLTRKAAPKPQTAPLL